MLWLVLACLAGWCITSVVLGVMLGRMIRHNTALAAMTDSKANAIHRRCVNRIVEATSTDHAVRVLREAAKDWEDPVAQGHMMLLAQRKYRAGGPSMPSIWLNDRADKIEEEHR